MEAREGAAGDARRKMQRRRQCRACGPRGAWWETAVPLMGCLCTGGWPVVARAEQGLWPVEEDRLEDSVEDLGAAEQGLQGQAGGQGSRATAP